MGRMVRATAGWALLAVLAGGTPPAVGAVAWEDGADGAVGAAGAMGADGIVPDAPDVRVARLDPSGVSRAALADLPDTAPPPAEEVPAGAAPSARATDVPSALAVPDDAPVGTGAEALTPGEAAGAAGAVDPVDPDVLTAPLDVAPFSVLGVTWDLADDLEGVVVRYRVRQAGTWTAWEAVGASDVAADADGAEGSPTRGATDAIVAVDADGVQLWAQAERGTVRGLTAVLVDPGEDPPAADATSSAFAGPPIISRAAWGADESAVGCTPDLSRGVRAAAIHHTASTNAYAAGDVPGLLRGFLAFHTRPETAGGRGWCDLGYNFLVDRFGRVFEGRGGGVDRPVVGVHTGGFNAATFGVAVIGTYGTVAPPAAVVESISRLVAWKFALHRIHAGASVRLVSGGGASKYPAGTAVSFPTIFGHRDAQLTSCPGQRLYDLLGGIRARVAALVDATVAASPLGSWDTVTADASGLTVTGWAFEPGRRAPIGVRITVDGTTRTVTADRSRSDVGARYPLEGPGHGFALRVAAGNGLHDVCVQAVNLGTGNDVTLGCTRVRVANTAPTGVVDAVRATDGGHLQVRGWALDRDSAGPVLVHVLVDGAAVRAVRADGPRPDVGRALGTDGRHGYAATVAAPEGVHRVCVHAINVPRGANPPLGCRSVRLGGPPIGHVDAVTGGAGAVVVRGWALDPSTRSPIRVHVYVDGRPVRSVPADRPRSDVDRVHGFGAAHGFSATVPAGRGRHTVCVYAIGIPAGPNPSLGCRTATAG